MPKITHVDIENYPAGLMVRSWNEGWQDDGSEDYIAGKHMETLLAEYEEHGFAVWVSAR